MPHWPPTTSTGPSRRITSEFKSQCQGLIIRRNFMTAADSVCRAVYADEWARIQAEGEIVKSGLRTVGSFIRLGEGIFPLSDFL